MYAHKTKLMNYTDIRSLAKLQDTKSIHKKSIMFPSINNEQFKKETKKTILFVTGTERIKYL